MRTWGLKLIERFDFKRAASALARKLAVTMHAILKSGDLIYPAIGATTVGEKAIKGAAFGIDGLRV